MKAFISRKFLLALVTQLGTTWLMYKTRIDAQTYGYATAMVVGAYITGNVVQKAADWFLVKKAINEKSDTPTQAQ